MNKKVKWGIIIFIGAGLIGGGIYSQLPKENKELAAADKVMSTNRNNKRILNVNAKIIKPQLLKDEIKISGSLLPDEEVDLSFETSGKIIEINFEEGSQVKKGQLLAKVNDRPLQVFPPDQIPGHPIHWHTSSAGRFPLIFSPQVFLRS